MQSDVLLSTIKGLPDNPLTKELLNQRRANEHVTSSVFLGANTAALQTAVFRDATGRMTVNYLFSYDRPEPGIIGMLPGKRLGYSVTLQTSVLTPRVNRFTNRMRNSAASSMIVRPPPRAVSDLERRAGCRLLQASISSLPR